MRYKRLAQWHKKQWLQFEILDNGVWVAGFEGRFAPVDRFLSNFNKPLRRRMLFTAPGTTFPASRVVRNPMDDSIFLLGQTRRDNDGSENYQELTVCHEVDGSSSALLSIRRKAPTGPANDPGWLVESVHAEVYGDFELRSSSEAEGSENEFFGMYFLHMPEGTGAKTGDYLTFNGEEYRIEIVYPDSGFEVARVAKRTDPRRDFVLNVKGTKHFNSSVGKVTSTEQSYNVTGVIKHNYDARDVRKADSSDYLTVFIDKDHIGFEPEPGITLTLSGTKYECEHVIEDSESSQYKLRFI